MKILSHIFKSSNGSDKCNGINVEQLALIAAFFVVIGDILALIVACLAIQDSNSEDCNNIKRESITRDIEDIEKKIYELKDKI
ncbi:hypothetical protein CLPU_1c00640 [Gottschalkia purinilytica]|uniref:Uncharacterized protein n=1 Tax=Gottschalkia purinilytica TaxID=1503 RepID=A0A0L0WEK5_GOTPU|nr:hypothetical protein [Gottschalkia purinilytica]KNF09899.1 hypothetical protein CLPU_1c00640 [Gottschalkia purinilytica]